MFSCICMCLSLFVCCCTGNGGEVCVWGGQNSRVSQQSGGFAERKQMSVQLSPFFSQGWGH